MPVEEIVIFSIVGIAILGTILFMFKTGIRPNSVMGKLLKKSDSCNIDVCKEKTSIVSSYAKLCSFHNSFLKLKSKRTPNHKQLYTQSCKIDAASAPKSTKDKLLQKLRAL